MSKYWKSVLRLEKNNHGRDFVCGDIHGCFDELEHELKEFGFNKAQDRLFCVGDLIDRGPKSELAIEYIASDWFFSVMGNHEWMFMMANTPGFPKRKDYLDTHVNNGGDWAYEIRSIGIFPKNTRPILDAIRELPLVIQVGNVLIAHASLPAVESIEQIEEDPESYRKDILWFRGEYRNVDIPGIDRVYVGHSIVREPKPSGKYLNIDTGAFMRYRGKEGELTVMEIAPNQAR
ncbi:MAG: metallophosphoesterase [Treponema sp.]|nr:metallophosphoesterase [Treponema sp.]